VIGADRLQYVVGAASVEVEILYENIAAVDLCTPSQWVGRPFIGLRLMEPENLYQQVLPFAARKRYEVSGYDWGIGDTECRMPLKVVRERILNRFREWRLGRPDGPCGAALNQLP
jgi:hypothetical protein